jgi:hypothetical protein
VVLYFPDHSFTFVFPGPAWPERAVYQRDRVPGGLGCVLGRRPARFCRFLNKWREERDVPRYRRLIDVEDVGPNILDDVLPKISAGNDEHLPQGEFMRVPCLFVSMVLRTVRPRSIKVRRAALRPVLGRVGNSHKSPARKPVYMN